MKTCSSKHCVSFNVDIVDNNIFYSFMLKILHLLKLKDTVLSQIFLPFYTGHHESQTTFICDSSEKGKQSTCQGSKAVTQAGCRSRAALLLGLPASWQQARPEASAPRAAPPVNPWRLPNRPVLRTPHGSWHTREFAGARPRDSAALLGVGAGGVRALGDSAVPHGRRGRTAQPCQATVQCPPAPPAAGPEAGAGDPLSPDQGSLSPAPSLSPAGSPQSGAAAGHRRGVGQPAPLPRGCQCPVSRPRRGKPCAPARGCPRPAASPRSPAPASRSRCGGSSWLRRAAAATCSARPGLLPRSLQREAGPAAASRRPLGRRRPGQWPAGAGPVVASRR